MNSPGQPASRIALAAWCLFDWGRHAFPTVILTFVFSAYFTKAVASSPVEGTALWTRAIALSGLASALLAPIIGAVADRSGRRKPWLAAATLLCVAATGLLWFAKPGAGNVVAILLCVGVASIAYEITVQFHNAMLAPISPPGMIGRISGWGWGIGYAGGLGCLILALVGLVQPAADWFGFGKAEAANIRATTLLAAGWFALFALPLFLVTPDQPSTGVGLVRAIGDGFAGLKETLRLARRQPGLIRFLIASALYLDGLVTLFAFGGLYAAGTFGMGFEEIIQFAIALNVTAGLGAALFGGLDDRLGSKRVITLALGGLLILGAPLVLVTGKGWFLGLALALGALVGPAQAAGRSLVARLAPPEMGARVFGLYALTGRATSFLGPLVLGVATEVFDSQRAGMATILLFWGAGLAVLWPVRDLRRP